MGQSRIHEAYCRQHGLTPHFHDDLRAIHVHGSTVHLDVNRVALHGLGFFEFYHVGSGHLARDHMICEHRDELTAVLDGVFRQDTTEGWLARLRHLLPAAPVLTLPQALDNPFAHGTGMVRDLPHPLMPEFRALANPIRLD